jgi:hypothetical protein
VGEQLGADGDGFESDGNARAGERLTTTG